MKSRIISNMLLSQAEWTYNL